MTWVTILIYKGLEVDKSEKYRSRKATQNPTGWIWNANQQSVYSLVVNDAVNDIQILLSYS